MTDLHRSADDVGTPAAPVAPAPETPTGRPRWVAPVVAGGLLAAGCAAVAIANPGDGGTPVCLSKAIFGVDCPFCGGLRATNSLLRGDWPAAADHNVLLAIALPLAAALWLVWLVQSLRGRELHLPRIPRPALWAGLGLLVVFTVLRNLPLDSGWIHWLASGTA